MKKCSKILSLLMTLVLMVSLLTVAGMAAGNANVGMTVDKTTVSAGDTVTIVVSNEEMTVSTFSTFVMFDKSKVECVSIAGGVAGREENCYLNTTDDLTPYVKLTASTASEANVDGNVGFGVAATDDASYKATKIATITLKIKADATGTTTVTLGEDSSGTDGVKNNSVKSVEITIKAPAHEHSWGEWTVTKEATCTEKGIETRRCACGETETRDIPLKDHTYGDWTVTKEATCTEKGEETRSCSVCGDKETRDIDKIDHTPAAERINVKSATCGADGYTGDVVCSACKEVLEKGQVVKATGKHVDENKDNKCDVCQKDLTPAPSGSGVTIVQKPVAMYFNDVLPTDWFYEDVLYVYTHGLMVGVSDTHFAPAANLTRGMLVTILYRMEGEPAVKFAGTFGDVADGLWYSDAVEWAAKNDIVKGYETGNFGPNDAITREQLATILYRYAKAEGYNVSAADDLADFSDAAQISEYAVPAMKWAVASGLLKGADGKLMPRANATRAEVAALIHRFDEKF